MTPQETPGRRRFRPRIWMTMVAIPALAMAVVYGAGIDPLRRNPYWASLERAKEWCATPEDTFWRKQHFDWSRHVTVIDEDGPEQLTLPCLVKISYISKIHMGNNHPSDGCDTASFCLSKDGRTKVSRNIHSWAIQGSEGAQAPAETAACRNRIAALPNSQWWIPVGDAIAVGFREAGGSWTTRLYDKSDLPPEVAALGAALQIDFR